MPSGHAGPLCERLPVQWRAFLCECEPPGWSSNDPHAYVTFYPPSGMPMPPATRVTDLLVAARYLINMPIMKRHGFAGVSLAFKNHFGSIDDPLDCNYILVAGIRWHLYRSLTSTAIRTSGPRLSSPSGMGLFGARDQRPRLDLDHVWKPCA